MIRGKTERALGIMLSLVLLLSAPAMAEIVLYASGSDQISSLGVIDIAEDTHGDLYFATDNGLSIYDGAWHITHMTYGNLSTGLLSDHVLAVEFDSQGNLWIGYPDGLQRIEGSRYVTIRDQQLLKSLDIHGLLRANRKMWVATGTAGVHRYQDGVWEWFRPQGPEGLGCNYVKSMVSDSAADTIFLACNEGIWSAQNTAEPVAFTPLFPREIVAEPALGIRSDPFGGIYIFNTSSILHYAAPAAVPAELNLIVSSSDLMPGIFINDARVDGDRTLWIATDYGIYAWKDGKVRDHLDASKGIRNNAVKKIYIDGADRLWFVTPENVGFFRITRKPDAANSVIPITTFSIQTTVPAPSPVMTPLPEITPAVSFSEIQKVQEVPATPSSPLVDLLKTIESFFARLLPH
jgi:ligand-binding sensor domain-containing protein